MSDHQDLDALDTAIKKLRLAYEKYFAGVERLEPIEERNNVKATLRRLRGEYTVNTARKFRLQQMQATLVTHESYWTRICRQIEEGTYRRHLLKVERLAAQREAETKLPPEVLVEAGPGAAAESAPSPAGAISPVTKPRSKRVAAKMAPSGPTYPDSVKVLHASYLEALRAAGSKQNLAIDVLAKTISRQTAAIKERYKCEQVDFKVVLKGNKPVLKAIPK